MSSVIAITSLSQLLLIQGASSTKPSIAFFWASWHDLSNETGQLRDIFLTLCSRYPLIQFLLIEAESVSDISEKFDISVVPTFISFIGLNVVQKLEGANPQELSNLVKDLDDRSMNTSFTTNRPVINNNDNNLSTGEIMEKALKERLIKLIHTAPVMVFIKGTPSTPKCGFSRQIVEILQRNDIAFASFDILSDEDVRQGLKKYSDWPTYPQLYVNGKLIGGLDILKEMGDGADLKTELGIMPIIIPPKPLTIQERLKSLLSSSTVMLFMKGTPVAPKCGFSKKIVDILNQEGIEFEAFDILADEEVRQGLKAYSDWPTYPQLYVNSKLIGGLDIVNDMLSEGSLKEQLQLM